MEELPKNIDEYRKKGFEGLYELVTGMTMNDFEVPIKLENIPEEKLALFMDAEAERRRNIEMICAAYDLEGGNSFSGKLPAIFSDSSKDYLRSIRNKLAEAIYGISDVEIDVLEMKEDADSLGYKVITSGVLIDTAGPNVGDKRAYIIVSDTKNLADYKNSEAKIFEGKIMLKEGEFEINGPWYDDLFFLRTASSDKNFHARFNDGELLDTCWVYGIRHDQPGSSARRGVMHIETPDFD